MPNGSLNLYFSIQSGNSEQTLVSLTDKTRALDKETQLLKQATEAMAKASKPLMEEQVRLQAQMQVSRKTVNELQKAYGEYGDDLSRSRLDNAIEQHAKLKTKLTEINEQLAENRKTYKDTLEDVRKGGLDSSYSNIGSSLKPENVLAGLNIGGKVSDLVQDIGGALAISALGTDMGGLAFGALSGILSGAAAGTAIGGLGIGTAIGAALGGASGLITGGTKIFEAKDDAFKEYYGGLYDDVKGRSGEMVSAGTSLASTRESDLISFTTLFANNEDDNDKRSGEEKAQTYLSEVVEMANSTPFLYDDLVSMSKTLATYGYDNRNILPLIETIGDAGAALGMSTSDMNSVAQALGRMKSSDKATLEYLNILNDRGIGAIGYLAEAKGKSIGETYDMISSGKITGTEAVEIITAALSRNKEDGGYKGSMEEQSKTFAGISSTLEGLQQNLNALGGEAYNKLRKEGIQAEVNALGGDGGLGDSIGEINRIMGENQARRENLQDQYMREVLFMVTKGEKGELWDKLDASQQDKLTEMSQRYAELMSQYEDSNRTDWEAGAELEALYETAQTIGQSYFEDSEEIQRLNEIEIDEIAQIRENTAGLLDAALNIYQQTQELSKGFGAVALMNIGQDLGQEMGQEPGWSEISSTHAFGLRRVPYNEYPALLHRDERVLTASEARAQDAGQSTHAPIQIPITGNIFTGMPEEIADQIAEIIVRKLEQAAVAAVPK